MFPGNLDALLNELRNISSETAVVGEETFWKNGETAEAMLAVDGEELRKWVCCTNIHFMYMNNQVT